LVHRIPNEDGNHKKKEEKKAFTFLTKRKKYGPGGESRPD